MLRQRSAGFTLLELMVVVAVLAILATMALPSFHGRIVRNQIVEAMKVAHATKEPVAKAWHTTGHLPANNAAAGLPEADKFVGNYVTAVQVEEGAVHVTFGNRASDKIKGKTLSVRPAVEEGAQVVPVAWVCGSAPVPPKMTLHGTDRTDLPNEYLPLNRR